MIPLVAAALAAYLLAVLSAVAGFGGGVLLLPVFTGLFGLRVAVPVLTLTQLVSNGSRVAFNRSEVDWAVVRRFALGAVPTAVVGGLLLAHAPLAALKKVLGGWLLLVVLLRLRRRTPRRPHPRTFVVVGAGSGLGSALLGSVGPLTAPFFLAHGLVRGAYIGTEAASALTLHVSKLAGYGVGGLLTWKVLLLGAALTPATVLGSRTGKHLVDRIDDRVFVRLVEVGLVAGGLVLLLT